jgi:Na+-transporting NADH:ubiquinone oxidoreductase subunit B
MRVNLQGHEWALLLALLPCATAGVVVTGYHVAASGAPVIGWRGAVAELLGAGVSTADPASCVVLGLLWFLPIAAAASAGAFVCTWAFASARRRDVAPGTVATVAVFVLLLPAGVEPWQAALGMAAGVIVGRDVFGGPGRTFVHPAIVGHLILRLTYPAAFRAAADGSVAGHGTDWGLSVAANGGVEVLGAAGLTWWDTFTGLDAGALGDTSALACVLGAALLLIHRTASWRVMTGALLGVIVASSLLADGPAFPGVPWTWHLTLGSSAFVCVFVATDPASGAFTNTGRWLHGALIGSLTVVIRVASPAHIEGALLAALLGSILTPLIDHGVVRLHVSRRRRHGRA